MFIFEIREHKETQRLYTALPMYRDSNIQKDTATNRRIRRNMWIIILVVLVIAVIVVLVVLLTRKH